MRPGSPGSWGWTAAVGAKGPGGSKNMPVTPARLRAIITALVVLVLGAAMTSGPAAAADSTLPSGYYLCHATSSASSPEDVKNWVTNSPSDAGQASGHAGIGHQNGLDVIPPIPGVLPQGQNWTAYGEQVHALGCRVPVDPEVTFTDSNCVQGGYVAPTVTAPTYDGLNRSTTGTVAPGATYTVSYTAKPGYGIVGPSSFTHTFAAFPARQADCDQPQPDVRRVPGSSSSCAAPAGVTSWVDVTTTPYVWDADQRRWVLGQAGAPVRTDETFTAYTDQEFFTHCAGDRPEAEERRVPGSQPSCALGGVTSWVDVWTTAYVWDAGQRRWVKGAETGPVRTDETFTAYADDEYFQKCAPDRPAPVERQVPMSDPSCTLGGVTTWTDVFTTRYVWSAQDRAWVKDAETGPVRVGETFTAWTDDEYFAQCGGNQPPPDVREVPMSDPSCALGGVTTWTDVYSTPYVWSAQDRDWVTGAETGPVRVGEAFAAWTDDEYFDACAPARPDAVDRRVPRSEPSCALGGVTSWIDVYSTPFVWDAAQRAWVTGSETGPVRTAESFTAWTDDEYFDACAPARPDAEERRVPMSDPSCSQGGVTSWTDVYSTPYVWSTQERDWVKGAETGPVRAGEVFTPYSDEEYFDACAPEQPAALTRTETGADDSCELRGRTTWTDTWTTPYVWEPADRIWVPGEETGPVRTEELDAWTDAEYVDACVDLEGEQETDDDPDRDPVAAPREDVAVRGSQQAAVPTVVNAGGSTGPVGSSAGGSWLAGLGLLLLASGLAAARRRPAARR